MPCGIGREAIERLETGPLPNLVFTDALMPGALNGFELANIIRARFSSVPVLLTSGYNDVPAHDTRLTVLSKPFDLATLGQAVRRAPDTVRD